jgi:hypothetical protein
MNEDWKTKEARDQSEATRVDVFSQFKASESQA